MILPVTRILDGHSVLSQTVEISGEHAQWLAAKNLLCRAEIDRIRSQLYIQLFFTGSVQVECARCCKPFDFPVQGDFRIVCVHRSEAGNTGKISDFSEEDIDFIFDDTTDEIDLTSLIYEEVMISLPMKPLCSEQCTGISLPKKGAGPSAAAREKNQEKEIDPRWEALKKLKIKN
jgi:uncharacterized protein